MCIDLFDGECAGVAVVAVPLVVGVGGGRVGHVLHVNAQHLHMRLRHRGVVSDTTLVPAQFRLTFR